MLQLLSQQTIIIIIYNITSFISQGQNFYNAVLSALI
jgi:hypothetical protein